MAAEPNVLASVTQIVANASTVRDEIVRKGMQVVEIDVRYKIYEEKLLAEGPKFYLAEVGMRVSA